MHVELSCPDDLVLEQFLLGRLADSASFALEEHLSSCSRCAARAEELQVEDDLVATMRQRSPILAGVDLSSLEQLAERVQQHAAGMSATNPGTSTTRWAEEVSLAPPEEPGEIGRLHSYRVLRVLGTGGMGIVYLARDNRLKRLVAVKLIPPGPRLAPSRLERFRREAELIARVHHANVVQLFEVGDWQCEDKSPAPYIVMEYVAGGTLADRLASGPLPPREAAELLLALARGVHAVHEKGVVHRDLKPGNVLLEKTATATVPKISDFGLARSLDTESGEGITVTGAILGTPSYMAPEQAGPREEMVTNAADVYSLGAVLYEMLTGRPPFRGATLLETIEQVRHQEAVSPLVLRPGLPRDLSIICLKCLEKDPRRRYASAKELADDLQRHLEGRPIVARPAGLLERLIKWIRRRPVVAGLMVVVVVFAAALLGGAAIYESRLRDQLEKTKEALEFAQSEGERADGNYRKARDTIQKMFRVTTDRHWSTIPRMQQLRRQQIESALAFYEEIARQKGDDPLVGEDVARACLEAAKIQLSLGRREQAEANAQRAVDLAEELVRDRPEDISLRLFQADALRMLGGESNTPQSMSYIERSVRELEGLVEQHPRSSEVRQQLAASQVTLGAAYYQKGKDAQALSCLVRAVELYGELIEQEPNRPEHRSTRARARLNLAAVCIRLKQLDRAQRENALAERDFEEMLVRLPHDRDTIDGLAVLRVNVAYAVAEREGAQAAVEYVSRNLPMLEQALKREPDDALVRDRLYRTHGVRAVMLDKLERFGDAARAWEQMMAFAAKVEPHHRLSLGHLLIRAGDHARGVSEIEAGVKDHPTPIPAERWKWLAQVYEEAATAAKKDTQLSTEKRQECQKRYRGKAVSAVVEAGKAGLRELWNKQTNPGAKKP